MGDHPMTIAIMKRLAAASAMALSAGLLCWSGGAALAKDMHGLEPEESDVLKIETPKPNWFYVNGGWYVNGTTIFDAKTGKMKGMVSTSHSADLAFDPLGKYYYVSETMWSKGNRGTRQDMVSVYDTTEMKLLTEITIPDRIIISDRKQNFIVSEDGKLGFIYNLSPASSVNVVDFAKRKFLKTIEVPGCATLIPNPGIGFSALCSDGSMATVNVSSAKPAITRSASFFSATDDPIFENFGYDKTKKQAVFLTYTGQIYTAQMAATPTISKPFSIQQAAGYKPGETKPLDLAWYPGGRQPSAYHRPSGQLYVLMHMGEYWSHKQGGDEIWIVDVATQKVVKRHPIKHASGHIEVTQDAEPKIFINDEEGNGFIIDAKTGKEDHEIKSAGSGIIHVADPS